MASKKTETKGLTVNAGSFRGSVYSQVVGVTVTDVDITLEFVYVNPRGKQNGEIVSRVTLPVSAASMLAKTILDTIKAHKEKKQGGKNA